MSTNFAIQMIAASTSVLLIGLNGPVTLVAFAMANLTNAVFFN